MAQEYAMLLPEKVVVRYPIAGIGSRILAHLLDIALCTALVIFLVLLSGVVLRPVSPDLAAIVAIVLIPSAPFLYFILSEAFWGGQTIGKRAARIRVTMSDGTPITPTAAVYRNIARFADFLPSFYLLGFGAMFFNPQSRRIGDYLAGTMVIVEQPELPTFTAAPHRFGVHPFEEHVGSLRGMTIEEYVLIKRLCDRFPELTSTSQAQMLLDVWEPFAQKRGVRPLGNVHPVYLMEAVIMRYGRDRGLI